MLREHQVIVVFGSEALEVLKKHRVKTDAKSWNRYFKAVSSKDAIELCKCSLMDCLTRTLPEDVSQRIVDTCEYRIGQ